jgi:hypothetical protein
VLDVAAEEASHHVRRETLEVDPVGDQTLRHRCWGF